MMRLRAHLSSGPVPGGSLAALCPYPGDRSPHLPAAASSKPFFPNKRPRRHHRRPRGLSTARFVIDHPAQSRKGASLLVVRVLCASILPTRGWRSVPRPEILARCSSRLSIPVTCNSSVSQGSIQYCIQDYVSAQSGEKSDTKRQYRQS